MTDDEFHAEADRLTADLDAASAAWMEVKGTPDHPDRDMRRLRLDAAQVALAEFRRYWRLIGAAVPDDHPGSRPAHGSYGVRVTDNVEA